MGYLEMKRDAMIGATPWFLPQGISYDDCIAAYQFKGASSQNASYTDLTGHGHTLSAPNGVEWDKNTGVKFGNNQFLTNSVPDGASLRVLTNIKSIVVYYYGHAELDPDLDGNPICFTQLKFSRTSTEGNPLLFGKLSFQRYFNGEWIYDTSKFPGIVTKWNTSNNSITYCRATTKLPKYGILACDNSQLYFDGEMMTTSAKKNYGCESLLTTQFRLNDDGYEILRNRGNYIYAAAFYSKKLTATQHKKISDELKKI